MGKKKISHRSLDQFAKGQRDSSSITGPSHFDADDQVDDNVDDDVAPINMKDLVKIYMWEFGQNDPKRDSGSKLCRLGISSVIRIGQSFSGIVLSSETDTLISNDDLNIINQYGIAGINCSWNRLEEIPFNKLGRKQNQRSLPILFAANSVNYGKPYKLNTAEAIAASLWICGLKDNAYLVMASFSYGMEFIRLNMDLLELYTNCKTSNEVLHCQNEYIKQRNLEQEEKSKLKVEKSKIGYIDEDDLPPMDVSCEYEYEDDDAIDINNNFK